MQAAAPQLGRGERPGSPTGNAYDKYGSRNPAARRLVAAFRRELLELLDRAAPRSLVDVGCGEGVLTTALAARLGGRRVLGVDRDDPALRTEWASRARSNVEYRVGDAAALPIADREFDVGCAIEVLEHVADPEAALGELSRVARRAQILSVPREPVWRLVNVARGAYLRSLGNTPGHVNHWSTKGFLSLVSRYGEVEVVRSPFPWTMVVVRLS